MERTHEPVAVLGIGAMGHGMAASALRAGIPTIVWNRRMEATRDLAELGAEVAETAADAARRASIVVTMVTDADAVLSVAQGPGHARCSGAGRDLGPDGHDRRGGDRPRRGHGRCPAPGRDAPGRAGVGKQGPGRTRPADDLRVRTRRGASACRSAVRRARPAHDLGRRGRDRDAAEAREQHLAGVRGRSGCRVRGSCSPAGP